MLSGWGRVGATAAVLQRPRRPADVAPLLATGGCRGSIARGLGRSYGDEAQNAGGRVIDMTALGRIRALDDRTGLVTVEAGISIDALLHFVLPRGWFLAVSPGTRFATIGGAIANDVHGKNHPSVGGFCQHVRSIKLLTPAHGVVTAEPRRDPDLFWATAGGLGLTGIMLEVTLQLMRVQTSRMTVDTDRASNFDDVLDRMQRNDGAHQYAVAWVDCLARSAHLGRSILTRANHARLEELPPRQRADPLALAPPACLAVPPVIPAGLLGRRTARAFNAAYFRRAPTSDRGRLASIGAFFYPLDRLAGWNRLYGRQGFVQYQFAVPFGAERVLQSVIERLAAMRCTSFLAVLKQLGPGGPMLSFPVAGWTLAVDISVDASTLQALRRFDEVVAEVGGRVYLAKDVRLGRSVFQAMYPSVPVWQATRGRVDPEQILRSDLGRRLGLCE
jgi:decaprenylphospho-beta-D-ribofuranose 2-oxidase